MWSTDIISSNWNVRYDSTIWNVISTLLFFILNHGFNCSKKNVLMSMSTEILTQVIKSKTAEWLPNENDTVISVPALGTTDHSATCSMGTVFLSTLYYYKENSLPLRCLHQISNFISFYFCMSSADSLRLPYLPRGPLWISLG